MTSGRESYWLFSEGKSLIYPLHHVSQGNRIMYFLSPTAWSHHKISSKKLVSKRKKVFICKDCHWKDYPYIWSFWNNSTFLILVRFCTPSRPPCLGSDQSIGKLVHSYTIWLFTITHSVAVEFQVDKYYKNCFVIYFITRITRILFRKAYLYKSIRFIFTCEKNLYSQSEWRSAFFTCGSITNQRQRKCL